MPHDSTSNVDSNDRKQPVGLPYWIALMLAIALTGMYHNQEDVGVVGEDYVMVTGRVADKDSTKGQVQIGSRQKKISFALLLATGVFLVFLKNS